MSPGGQILAPKSDRWTTTRFVGHLLGEIRGAVLWFLVLYSAATLAQIVTVLLVSTVLAPEDSSALFPLVPSRVLPTPISQIAVIGVVVLLALGADFLADRALIRARREVAVAAFRLVLLPILERKDREVVLVGSPVLGSLRALALRGLTLGQPLRLLLMGVFSGLRGFALLVVAFGFAGMAPVAVLAVVGLAAPFFLHGARRVSTLEASRPEHRRAARKATSDLLDGSAAIGFQPRLPLEPDAATADGEAKRLAEEAEAAVGHVAESTVGRLLVASRAKFQYQMVLVVTSAATLLVIGRFGVPSLSLGSAGPSALAPVVIGALLALRALASAFQGFVRLSSSVLTVSVLAAIRAEASATRNPWALRRHLEHAAARLRTVDDEGHY